MIYKYNLSFYMYVNNIDLSVRLQYQYCTCMVNACNSDLLVIRTVDNSWINRKLGPNYRVYQLSSTVHNFLPF